MASENASIVILPSIRIVSTDNFGNYRFENLKKGAYKIMVIDYNSEPKKFDLEIISEDIRNFDLVIDAKCKVSAKIAELDIENNKPRLLVFGGIAPYTTHEDGKFGNKYGIMFQVFGDTAPPMDCLEQYNNRIFQYLDKKFGGEWRKEVRKDVVGFD